MTFLVLFFLEHSVFSVLCALVLGAGASFLVARYVYRKPEKKPNSRAKKSQESEETGESGALPTPETKRAARSSEKSDALRNLTITERRSIFATGIGYLLVACGAVYFGLISEYLATKAWAGLPLLRVLFVDKMIFFVIGFSLAGGVANVFQNIVIGSNSVQMFNNLISKKHLFVDKSQYNALLKKFLSSAYSRSWNFWTSVQPLLSMLVGLVVYFVFLSGIAWSGAERTNPNIFFYAAMAFLSGFFYDKFLEFLSRISNQVLGGEGSNPSVEKENASYMDRIVEIFSGFDREKLEILIESITQEKNLSESYEKDAKTAPIHSTEK